jgi:hypothetical protein
VRRLCNAPWATIYFERSRLLTMARILHVRGMLLEEALLRLLQSTGYKTVDDVNGDPTLDRCSASLLVASASANAYATSNWGLLSSRPAPIHLVWCRLYTSKEELKNQDLRSANRPAFDTHECTAARPPGRWRIVLPVWRRHTPPGRELHSHAVRDRCAGVVVSADTRVLQGL